MMYISANKIKILRKAATATGVIMCLLITPILMFNLGLGVKSAVYPDRIPAFMDTVPLIVNSTSMENSTHGSDIARGDLALIHQTDIDSVRIGNVVAFTQGGATLTQRVTAIQFTQDETVLLTKGDNPTSANTVCRVGKSQLIGIINLSIPGAGSVAQFLQKPVGRAAFIGIPIMLLALFNLFLKYVWHRGERNRMAAMSAEVSRLGAYARRNTAG